MGRTPWWDVTTQGYEGLTYAVNPWDTGKIDDVQIPGVVEVDAKPGRDVDKKKEAGSDGSVPTIHGYRPTDIELRILIWTKPQLDALEALIDQLWPAVRKKTPTPKPVVHPALQLYNITAATVVGVKTPSKQSITGAKMFAWVLLEHALSTGKSATTTPIAPVPLVPQFQDQQPLQPPQGSSYKQTNAPPGLPSSDPSSSGP